MKHVPDNPRLFVISAAVFHPHALCGGDLHVVHVPAVPNRLEDGIGEAEDQNVLHGFFAEIMVDAINLSLVKDLVHLSAEFSRGREIPSERLLDHDSCPSRAGLILARQAAGADLANDRRIEIRASRKVKDAVLGGSVLALGSRQSLFEAAITLGLLIIAVNVDKTASEFFPPGSVS